MVLESIEEIRKLEIKAEQIEAEAKKEAEQILEKSKENTLQLEANSKKKIQEIQNLFFAEAQSRIDKQEEALIRASESEFQELEKNARERIHFAAKKIKENLLQRNG